MITPTSGILIELHTISLTQMTGQISSHLVRALIAPYMLVQLGLTVMLLHRRVFTMVLARRINLIFTILLCTDRPHSLCPVQIMDQQWPPILSLQRCTVIMTLIQMVPMIAQLQIPQLTLGQLLGALLDQCQRQSPPHP